jgi:hypothetical protein
VRRRTEKAAKKFLKKMRRAHRRRERYFAPDLFCGVVLP